MLKTSDLIFNLVFNATFVLDYSLGVNTKQNTLAKWNSSCSATMPGLPIWARLLNMFWLTTFDNLDEVWRMFI